MSQREKRREKRLDEENKVILKIIPEKNEREEIFYSLTEDISPGGLRIITDKPFPVKTKLKVEIVLPDEKKVIEGLVEVRWIKNRPEGEIYEMGLEFVELDGQNKIHLLEHVYKKVTTK